MVLKYRVHKFEIKMAKDQYKLEEFLNSMNGDVVSIIPNSPPAPVNDVDFVLIVEKRR